MDSQDLVAGIRWDILKHIAKQPSTGAELARTFGTSAANITQHLKLLELTGVVTKERVNGKSMHYKLAADQALVTVLCTEPERASVQLEPIDKLALQLLVRQKPYSKHLRRFIFRYEDLIKDFTGFGVIRHDGDIELLVIAEDVKPLRKEYANLHILDKKVVIWSHTPDELQEGLERKEHYFLDKLRALDILYDPQGFLTKTKEDHP